MFARLFNFTRSFCRSKQHQNKVSSITVGLSQDSENFETENEVKLDETIASPSEPQRFFSKDTTLGLFPKTNGVGLESYFYSNFLTKTELANVSRLSTSLHDDIIKNSLLKSKLIMEKINKEKLFIEEQNFNDLLSWLDRIKTDTHTKDDLEINHVIAQCKLIGELRFITQGSHALGEATQPYAFLYYGCHHQFSREDSIYDFWRSHNNETIFNIFICYQFKKSFDAAECDVNNIKTNFLPKDEEVIRWKQKKNEIIQNQSSKLRPIRS